VKVDMLGYSFGGLVSRAYVQSAAYGAEFTVGGRTFSLPEVDKLMLLATPSQGSAISYPFWNNDTASFSASLLSVDINVVSAVLKPVYRLVVHEGRKVTGPSGMIHRAAITDPVTGRPDPRAFLQKYFASLRDMLPTYAFLSDGSGRLSTINDTPFANRILLDLNATSSPGVNPWTANVGQVTATFGVHPRAWLTGWAVTTETYVREVIADGSTGSIWPFQSSHRIRPAAGTIYFEKQALAARGRHGARGVAHEHVCRRPDDHDQAVVQWHASVRPHLETDIVECAARPAARQFRRTDLHPQSAFPCHDPMSHRTVMLPSAGRSGGSRVPHHMRSNNGSEFTAKPWVARRSRPVMVTCLPSRWNHIGWFASDTLATAEDRVAGEAKTGEGHQAGCGFGHRTHLQSIDQRINPTGFREAERLDRARRGKGSDRELAEATNRIGCVGIESYGVERRRCRVRKRSTVDRGLEGGVVGPPLEPILLPRRQAIE
jgi:hypothetical protein